MGLYVVIFAVLIITGKVTSDANDDTMTMTTDPNEAERESVGQGLGPTEVSSENVYMIGVHRTAMVYTSNDIVSTETIDENQQSITYYETVDVDNPFMIDGSLWNSTNDVFEISGRDAINACLEYEEGTWEKFLVDVTLKQLSPTASCPIYPGTYTVYKDYQVTEIFDEMLSCNDYNAYLYVVNGKGQCSFELNYTLDVDSGPCA